MTTDCTDYSDILSGTGFLSESDPCHPRYPWSRSLREIRGPRYFNRLLERVCKPPSRVILSGVSSWAKVGDDTESKNPLASEGASTRHSTGFLDCVPTRLRPLGTPLRMTAHKGVRVCKHALARISHTLGESGDRVLSRPLLSSEFQVQRTHTISTVMRHE